MKILRFLAAAWCAAAFAQIAAPLAPSPNPVIAKNFHLLARIEADAAVARQLESDTALRKLIALRREAIAKAAGGCGLDAKCYFQAFRFNGEEIDRAAERLKLLASADGPLQVLTQGALRDSGAYVRWRDLGDGALIDAAWRDAANGINRLIDVYGEGKALRYPAIDAMSFAPDAQLYQRHVSTLASILAAPEENELFFTPSLRFAYELLMLNRRDEAGRHEPLEAGENRAAVQAMRTVRWNGYPYSVIVVPGAGGSDLVTPLSAGGRLRSMIAAQRWKSRQAPFVLVSGGYVHPKQTPFAEALEMKRVLMREFGVPESAILIDPHARHTTTNMRNAARLMFRYGVPLEKPALVTTDASQSAYIENPAFAERCRNELGYVPYRLGKRLNRFDQEFYALIESLQFDNTDPLDP